MICHAFTDESGNTGLNLFDTDQESFWTGTLISFADVDTRYKSFHNELLTLVGRPELHGADLGFGGIEKIGARLAWFIREKKLRFSFGRVHKPFLAASKLFDLTFDSGTNRAMVAHAYGIRTLRLMLLMHFAQLLDLPDLKEFWDAFSAQDSKRFGALLGQLLQRAKVAGYDKRTIQILCDALGWGSQHPEAILDPFGEGDSPNLVAFCGLFNHLHLLHEQEGHVVGSFVHDEQNQFIPLIKEYYKMLSKWRFSDHPLANITDVKQIPSFDCALIVKSSSQSFGLQLVDICLWMIKRVVDKGDKPRGLCRTLFECLAERSWISRFDFTDLVENVRAGVEYVSKLPVTEEQMEKGRSILEQFERKRLAVVSGEI
jgi:hypothetical protein